MSKMGSKGMSISQVLVRKKKSQMRNSINKNLIIEEEDQIINS
jgi:N-acetylglutamate synthase-like GNAT family acetyltransferase